MSDQKNMVIFLVLTAAIWFGWLAIMGPGEQAPVAPGEEQTSTGEPGQTARTDSLEPVGGTGIELDPAEGPAGGMARGEALAKTEGNSHSLCLDLHDQYVSMEKNGQWRFTPPVQTILTFDRALQEFAAEGGVEGRGGRYRQNCRILVDGMRRLARRRERGGL